MQFQVSSISLFSTSTGPNGALVDNVNVVFSIVRDETTPVIGTNTLTLSLPIADADDYTVGQVYDVSLTLAA